jgi:hypothetical protein
MRHMGLGIVLLEQTPLHEPTLTSSSSFSVRSIKDGERYNTANYKCESNPDKRKAYSVME